MAKNKKSSSSKKKVDDVEAFEEDLDEDVDVDDEDLEDEDDEDDEPLKTKAKKRAVEEEEDDEDDEDEDEDEDEGKILDVGFAPFIVSEGQEWEIADIIGAADEGDTIYLYAPPAMDDDDEPTAPAKWYKLVPVKIGETPAEG